MHYFLDSNSLSADVLEAVAGKGNFSIVAEVLEEEIRPASWRKRILDSGILVRETNGRHLKKLENILSLHGGNFKLIRLYTGKGNVDVLMLAHMLVDREDQEKTLFPGEWRFVTEDRALRDVAATYGVKSISWRDLLRDRS